MALVRMRGITKRFGDLVANDGVDLDLEAGRIHVLLGENGAGKTTLMNILFGHLRPDAGTIEIDGEPAEFASPADALARGVGMVHQHFSLVPSFTVAENVLLGSRASRPARLRGLNDEVGQAARRYGLALRPEAKVGLLPVEEQQRVEILKALYRGARILVLDEPTALLGPAHVEALLDSLRHLREQGHALVLVTHKLSEVMQVADTVTVLRGGRLQLSAERGALDERALARAMTGHDLADLPEHADTGRRGDDPTLVLRAVTVEEEDGRRLLDGLDLEVRPGEIVGIAGVEGNGQPELVDVLAGLRVPASGTVRVQGAEQHLGDPRTLRQAGLGIVPKDRHGWGLVGDMTLAQNLALADIPAGGYQRRGMLQWSRIRSEARTLLEQFDVRPPDPDARADTLSGGNQQKVVLARELARDPALLVADNPTWGLDVGAIDYVHRRLLDVRAAGRAVLLVSLDLDELLALSDRLVVLFRGRAVLSGPVRELTGEQIALAMAGGVKPALDSESAPIL